jgi:lipoate-protein ligase A
MTKQIWRLLDLGAVEPVATQAVYDAVAVARSKRNVPDTLIICWPKSPLVCVGYFQEVDKEVDVGYCKAKSIPIVRRILGGGAVYLDSNQVFYQIIGERGSGLIPTDIGAIFRKMLEAPIKTCQEIGIPATYKPINDIEIKGKKISGNGAGEVDGIAVLTGNIILDFNYEEMTKILKVPDEKFRDKLVKSLSERLTTVRRELGHVPSHQRVKELLVENFKKTLDIGFDNGSLTKEEQELLEKLTKEKYLSNEWTYENSKRHPTLSLPRIVKVSGRSIVGQAVYKSVGGIVRITGEFVEGKINDVLVSGDFTFLPSGKIAEFEKTLVGVELEERKLMEVIDNFYKENGIESPGTTSIDFAKAILIAAGSIHQQ